jgi:hypothetical protein
MKHQRIRRHLLEMSQTAADGRATQIHSLGVKYRLNEPRVTRQVARTTGEAQESSECPRLLAMVNSKLFGGG